MFNITNQKRQVYRMRFKLCIYTRYRKTIFQDEAVFEAFHSAIINELNTADVTIHGVERGVIGGTGRKKYENSFLTLDITTEWLSPHDIYNTIRETGWKAICMADSRYSENQNLLAMDYLVIAGGGREQAVIYDYAYSRDSRTKKEKRGKGKSVPVDPGGSDKSTGACD